MIRTHITAPALLALPFKPLRVWLINRQITQSQRNVEVMQMQREQLRVAETHEVWKQIHLSTKRNAIERQ